MVKTPILLCPGRKEIKSPNSQAVETSRTHASICGLCLKVHLLFLSEKETPLGLWL